MDENLIHYIILGSSLFISVTSFILSRYFGREDKKETERINQQNEEIKRLLRR